MTEASTVAVEQRDREQISETVLVFRRHGERETDSSIPDKFRKLTPQGRAEAASLSPGLPLANAVAVGGKTVDRLEENSGRLMTGDSESSLEEMREKYRGEAPYPHSKLRRNAGFLDAKFEVGEYGPIFLEMYKLGKLTPWLINDSDRVAKELGVAGQVTSFTIVAGNLAEPILGYINSARKYRENYLAGKQPKMVDEPLARYFTAQNSMLECLLVKIMEKTSDPDQYQKDKTELFEVIGEPGFDFLDGFTFNIKTFADSDEPEVTINFESRKKDSEDQPVYKFNRRVPAEVFEQIIEDRKNYLKGTSSASKSA